MKFKPDPRTSAAIWKRDGVSRNSSWSLWLKSTGLKPEMDAKDWYAIWDTTMAAAPDEKVDFEATHWMALNHPGYPPEPFPVMLVEENEYFVRYYREYSPGDIGLCSDPRQYITSFEPISWPPLNKKIISRVSVAMSGMATFDDTVSENETTVERMEEFQIERRMDGTVYLFAVGRCGYRKWLCTMPETDFKRVIEDW